MKSKLSFLFICLGLFVQAQIVNIPDANFKAYLIGNTAINTNGDSEIQVSEAATYTGSIDCIGLNISDLTGIEAFVNLTSLNCSYNLLSSLDLSNNTALTYLNCMLNQLTGLNVSSSPNLSALLCNNNLLTSLNINNNPALNSLYCYGNQLSSLNISNNTMLGFLDCAHNSLGSLDVSNNPALYHLECSYNNIAALDVSNNPNLSTLYCYYNALTSLDVSNNTALIQFLCINNNLNSLNLANGNNAALTYVWTSGNPNLTCIQVDDPAYSTTNWTGTNFQFDPWSNFSSCCIVNIPDVNFKNYLLGNPSINTNGDSEIQCSEAQAFSLGQMICTGLGISDLTGIEAFVNLPYLDCSNNLLSSLDVSNNTALVELHCGNNQLTSINTGNNTTLVVLSMNNNQLPSIDVGSNTGLVHLFCSSNQLTNLDVSNNPALTQMNCSNNNLVSLNLANGSNTALTYIGATGNANLTCIQVDDPVYSATNWTGSNFQFDPWASFSEDCNCIINIPDANFKNYLLGNISINTNGDTEIQCSEAQTYTGQILCGNLGISDLTGIEAFVNITDLQAPNNALTSLDLSNNTALTHLYLFNNQLSTIDLSNNPALIQLTLYGNQLTSLDVSNNTALTVLLIDNNQLTSIDVSNNLALIGLSLNDNQLSTVDVNNNTALYQLTVHNNPLTTLDVSHNPALVNLYCANTQITDLDLSNNPILATLIAHGSQLTSLDLSNNSALTQITCNDNNLSSLNLSNGNNTALIGIHAFNNPNLICIEVDDADYSNSNWTGTNFQFDSWASFSEDCNMGTNNFAGNELEIYPNPAQNLIYVKLNMPYKNARICIFDLSGRKLSEVPVTGEITPVSISAWQTSIYNITIVTENGTRSAEKRVIKK